VSIREAEDPELFARIQEQNLAGEGARRYTPPPSDQSLRGAQTPREDLRQFSRGARVAEVQVCANTGSRSSRRLRAAKMI
jgi:hypothetical protein